MPLIEQPDPEHFGDQPDGSYLPCPAEIARKCAEIRKGESKRTERRRAPWRMRRPYTVPEVAMGEAGRR